MPGADEKGKWDELVEDRGVRILIEPAALMHVIGTTMDFTEDRIKCAPALVALPRLASARSQHGHGLMPPVVLSQYRHCTAVHGNASLYLESLGSGRGRACTRCQSATSFAAGCCPLVYRTVHRLGSLHDGVP